MPKTLAVIFVLTASTVLSFAADDAKAGALAEAAKWSGGLAADVEIPADYDARRGAAVVACTPERLERLGTRGFREIGVVR